MMIRAHRLFGKALATFLVVFQGVAAGYVVGVHADSLPGAAMTLAASDDAGGGAVQHTDLTCQLCLLASSHAQHAATPQVTAAPDTSAEPHAVMAFTRRPLHRRLLDASPRAPPAQHV